MTAKDVLQLRDESVFPDKEALEKILGESYKAYENLTNLFESLGLRQEWRYYKDGKAWLCKVQKKKKTIVWLSVWEGYVQAAIYFPVRLQNDVLELEIQQKLKDSFLETKNVGKTKPFIVKIKDDSILDDLEKVVLFKIKSK